MVCSSFPDIYSNIFISSCGQTLSTRRAEKRDQKQLKGQRLTARRHCQPLQQRADAHLSWQAMTWNSVSILRSALVSCTQCNDRSEPLVLPQGLWTPIAFTVCLEKGLLPIPLQQGKGRGKFAVLQLLQPMAVSRCKLPLTSSHINSLATTL